MKRRRIHWTYKHALAWAMIGAGLSCLPAYNEETTPLPILRDDATHVFTVPDELGAAASINTLGLDDGILLPQFDFRGGGGDDSCERKTPADAGEN